MDNLVSNICTRTMLSNVTVSHFDATLHGELVAFRNDHFGSVVSVR